MLPLPRFEIRRSWIGRRRWRTVLIGENGEILMVSEHLNSMTAAKGNIEAAIRATDGIVPVVDTTSPNR